MTEEEIVGRLKQHFRFLFPDKSDHRPCWVDNLHKSKLFAIFRDCHSHCPSNGRGLIMVAKDDWAFESKTSQGITLSKEDEEALHRICDAWDEWFYAFDHLQD